VSYVYIILTYIFIIKLPTGEGPASEVCE